MPKRIADHGNGIRVAQLVDFRSERAAENGSHAENREVGTADQADMRGSAVRGGIGGLEFDRDAGGEVRSREHAGKRLIVLLQLLKFGIGNEIPVAIGEADFETLLVGICEKDELLRVLDGKIAEQHGIDDREDGGVGADAERKSEDGDRRESGRFAQHAEGEAQIPCRDLD